MTDWDTGRTLTADELDVMDFAPQHVQDTVLMRTVHGVIDFAHGLEDIVEEEIHDIEEHGREKRDERDMPAWLKDLRHHKQLAEVRSVPRAARKYSTTTFVIPAGGDPVPIDLRTADRIRSVVSNSGGNAAYIGPETDTNGIPSVQSSSSQQLVEPSNPAAGAGFTFTVVTACQLASLFCQLTTSAVVANRFFGMTIKDAAGNTIVNIADGTAITASSTAVFTLAQGVGIAPSGASNALGALPTDLTLLPGWTINIAITAEDAGDQLSRIALALAFASPTVTSAQFGWVLLAISGPLQQREIRAKGKIFAYSPLGTTVDVQTEFGDAIDPIAAVHG